MLDKESSNAQLSVGVTYASLMSAVSLFFTGILISQYHSFNATIKVPIVFLIISTFSFVFAATIYSNAGNEITLNKLKTVEKYMIYAKNIVELLGLYPFILATPLVIGAVTGDGFLRTTTIIVAIVGFSLYSQSKFSILEKELPSNDKRYLSALIVVLALSLYATQTAAATDSIFVYSLIAIILLVVLIIAATGFCLGSKQYKSVTVRTYDDEDAETLSEIIIKNLDRVKSRRYPKSVIDTVRSQSSPSAVRRLAKEQHLFVAELDDQPVGLIGLEDNRISHIFTDPGVHRKGVGRFLVDRAEAEAYKQHHQAIEVTANTIDHNFYKKLGYHDNSETTDKNDSTTITMRKKLYRSED